MNTWHLGIPQYLCPNFLWEHGYSNCQNLKYFKIKDNSKFCKWTIYKLIVSMYTFHQCSQAYDHIEAAGNKSIKCIKTL